jgi:hypothetical protein
MLMIINIGLNNLIIQSSFNYLYEKHDNKFLYVSLPCVLRDQ